MGTKRAPPPLLPSRLLARGIAIASLDYRLSGDAVFPAAVQDCKAAVRWLRAHAEYGFDAARVVAWGESAGAHLASMLGVTCSSSAGADEEEFEVGDHLDVSSAVAGVVAYYGPTDFMQMDAQVGGWVGLLLRGWQAGTAVSAWMGCIYILTACPRCGIGPERWEESAP